jgi:hypothetical protein
MCNIDGILFSVVKKKIMQKKKKKKKIDPEPRRLVGDSDFRVSQ